MSLAGETHSLLSPAGLTSTLSNPILSSSISTSNFGEADIFSTIPVPTVMSHTIDADPTTTMLSTFSLANHSPYWTGNRLRESGDSTTVDATRTEQVSSVPASSSAFSSRIPSTTASISVDPSISVISATGSQPLDVISLVSMDWSTDAAGTSTISTTVPATPTLSSANHEASLGAGLATGHEHMVSDANILKPENKLFPLGIVAVIVGSIVALAVAALLAWKISRYRRRKKLGDRILSFSPDMRDATPYPFHAKALTDVESRLPNRPPRIDPNYESASSSPFPPVGIASTLPLRPSRGVDEYYNRINRGGHLHSERPDAFTCALYSPGTRPREYEKERDNQIALGLTQGPGSPVPSFNTGRHDTAVQDQQASGKLLTPPPSHPRYKSKHVPAPLLITPSFSHGTDFVRGFTPRRSNTVSTMSSSSLYTAM